MAHSDRIDNVQIWLQGRDFQAADIDRNRTTDQLHNVPLFEMDRQERRTLLDHWVAEIQEAAGYDLAGTVQHFATLEQRLQISNQETDLRCLQQAQVIGVTTSGLARHSEVLRRLRPKVVLCEEAGEILEAHTLTAFLPSIEHGILIGDHEQL